PPNPAPAMGRSVLDTLTERAPPSPPSNNIGDVLTEAFRLRGYTPLPSTWREFVEGPYFDMVAGAAIGAMGVGWRGGGQVRRFGIPPSADPPLFSYRNTSTIRAGLCRGEGRRSCRSDSTCDRYRRSTNDSGSTPALRPRSDLRASARGGGVR